MEKELIINPPEGWEVDEEKSTFEKIVYKPIKELLPTKWEDIKSLSGFYVSEWSGINDITCGSFLNSINTNVFATKEQAEASIALAQLSQLKKVYNGGWEPDWENLAVAKFVIVIMGNRITCQENFHMTAFLAFKTREIRDEFLKNFRDLIEQAKPLLS